ncbi:MAG: ATP-binding protein [Scytonema sp. PMC 1069.18]|nr:ATP-binding protein [Scytonema sp. PMC 1069.18]MEC4880718.1 ATP-binding protein [Scytonema sp. PMC 1070.18]
MSISLKRILNKPELLSLLENLVGILNTAIDVEQMDGTKLMTIGEQTSDNRHPIEVSGEVIGWVVGGEQATLVANLLSLLAKQEAEKKVLAKELLERYQEIDLFEDISTQLTTSLDKRQIAQLVLQEISQLMESTAGTILLLNPDASAFEIIAEFGQFFDSDRPEPGQGIIGNIVQLGRAEIVNDVQADPRLKRPTKNMSALVCAPLRAKERVIGAIAIGSHKTDSYTTEHLKLVSIFASQTAIAIEKALLYEQSCQATTQAKAQAELLQQALHDLQLAQTQLIQSEKMSSLGQLIAGVAHEINNPVNFICGNLKYVAEYATKVLHLLESYQEVFPVPPQELQSELDNIDLEFLMQDLPKLLDSMKVGTNRIVEIVKSLKNFSRHDEAEMKTVNIHEGIDGTLMILHHRLKAAPHHPGIAVVKDYGELSLVECYPGQLNQVFMNILANAIDALEDEIECRKWDLSNHKQDFTPTIHIRTETVDDKWIVIRIADNGSGMTEDVMRRIYDPFFTTKEVGKGTGLGMAISHQIVVNRHRGILKCRSQLGEGTEFWIQIPVSCSTVNASLGQSSIISATKTAIALQNSSTESLPPPDAEGFIPSVTPILQPSDLLVRHIQLIERLSQQTPDVNDSSPERIYWMFQHNPISLKLYATLLSRLLLF